MIPSDCCKLFKHASFTDFMSNLNSFACFKAISSTHLTKFGLYESEDLSITLKLDSIFLIVFSVSVSVLKSDISDKSELKQKSYIILFREFFIFIIKLRK